jgi:hypothetical protein
VFFLVPLASASPLNPWGAHVGEGALGITPFLFVDQGPAFYPLIYGQYGVTGQIDVMAGAGATIGRGFSFDTVELMPRYFFSDSSAAVLHATWFPAAGALSPAPEYHGVYELSDSLALTTNVGWAPLLAKGFTVGSVTARSRPSTT